MEREKRLYIWHNLVLIYGNNWLCDMDSAPKRVQNFAPSTWKARSSVKHIHITQPHYLQYVTFRSDIHTIYLLSVANSTACIINKFRTRVCLHHKQQPCTDFASMYTIEVEILYWVPGRSTVRSTMLLLISCTTDEMNCSWPKNKRRTMNTWSRS